MNSEYLDWLLRMMFRSSFGPKLNARRREMVRLSYHPYRKGLDSWGRAESLL